MLQLQGEDLYAIKSTGTGVVAAFVDRAGDTVIEQTDASGKFRIDTTDPSTSDTAGSIVGP